MANDSGSGYRGPSFLTLLGLLFIGLRLAGLIDWPWWQVLAPLWVRAIILLAAIAIVVLDEVIEKLEERP